MEDTKINSAIALLSSGLDSVTSISLAREHIQIRLALVFDYGQRSARREIEYSRKVCEHYNIPLHVIRLDWLAAITQTSLVNTDREVPVMSQEMLAPEADPAIAASTAKSVWVPNRNGVLINIAASFAESMECKYVVTGFNREEAANFPDNSPEFIAAIDNSLSYSTLNKVKVLAPLLSYDKKDIVLKALEAGSPLEYSWSCYMGEELPCGLCESCIRRIRAFSEAGVEDPLLIRLLKK